MEVFTSYAQYLYTAPSAQLAFELSLVVLLVYMLKRGPGAHLGLLGGGRGEDDRSGDQLSDLDKARILSEYQPDSLVDDCNPDHYALRPRVVKGRVGKLVELSTTHPADTRTLNNAGSQLPLLNLATHNYLGLADLADSRERAIRALRNYGVGSCGPRGFYGTADVHLALEARLARFMGVEEACLYSYGFSAISSAIPSYSKQHDVIFADEQVNFAIQQGITASRSEVHYFRHNDPADLERLLTEFEETERRGRGRSAAKERRRFFIVEGIYANTGTLLNLPAFVELRRRFRCRLFIEESLSFGVLGAQGRGVREHFGIANNEIDLMAASLEHAVSSYGGFVAGSHFLMEHQRLCGLGYCFSASLPPMQAVVSITHLDIIRESPEIMANLRTNSEALHGALAALADRGVTVLGHPLSPIKHLQISHVSQQQSSDKEEKEEKVVQQKAADEEDVSQQQQQLDAQKRIEQLASFCETEGLMVTPARCLTDRELLERPPSIRITVNARLTAEDIERIASVLSRAPAAISGSAAEYPSRLAVN